MWIITRLISKGDYTYAYVPEHPNATKNGYVLEHRVVAENYLKRLLKKDEIVHHLNEIKKDNREENLALTTKAKHNKLHNTKGRIYIKLKCPWCEKIFEKEKRRTHLKMKRKYPCTSCSPTCRGKLSREIQLNGITKEIKKGIKENVIEEKFIPKKYKFVKCRPIIQLEEYTSSKGDVSGSNPDGTAIFNQQNFYQIEKKPEKKKIKCGKCKKLFKPIRKTSKYCSTGVKIYL